MSTMVARALCLISLFASSAVASSSSSASSATGSSVTDFNHSDGPNKGTDGILFISISLLFGVATKIVWGIPAVQKYFPVPYTVVLFLFGTIWGALDHSYNMGVFGRAMHVWTNLDPHVFLMVFLPALLFESGLCLNVHIFKRLMWQAILLAGPGVLITMFLAGCYIKGIFADTYHWDWDICFLFGAMSAATDPVAVVALLGELGAPESLGVLVEGESLINDGSAFVAFLVMLDVIEDGEVRADNIFISFARLALAGAGTGIAMGYISTQFLRHNYTFGDDVAELAVLLAVPYFTFWIAEGSEAQMSGVLACVCLTIYMKNYSHFHTFDLHSVHTVYTIICWICNTLVFMISGGMAGQYIHIWTWTDVGLLLALYGGLTAVRMLTIAMLWYPLSLMGYGFDWKQGVVLTWGALRGAIGLAMAAIISHEDNIDKEVREKVYLHMSGIVALTLVVNGSTMGWALSKLGYTVRSKARNILATEAVIALERVAMKEITRVKRKKAYNHCDWKAVLDTINMEHIEHLFCDEGVDAKKIRKKQEDEAKTKLHRLSKANAIEDDEKRHELALKHAKQREVERNGAVTIRTLNMRSFSQPSLNLEAINCNINDERSSRFTGQKLSEEEAYLSLREQFLQSFVAKVESWRDRGDLSATAAKSLEEGADDALDEDALYGLDTWWTDHMVPELAIKSTSLFAGVSSVLHCYGSSEHFEINAIKHSIEIAKSFCLVCQKVKLHVLVHQHDDDSFHSVTDRLLAEIKVSVRHAANFVVALIEENPHIARQVDTRRAIGHVIHKMMDEINDMSHHGQLHGDEKKMLMAEMFRIERKLKHDYASATLKTNEHDVIAHTPLFLDLDESELQDLTKMSQNKHYEKGDKIIYADSGVPQADGRHLIVVLAGHCNVQINGDQIHYSDLHDYAGPGTVIGASKIVLQDHPCDCSAGLLHALKAAEGIVRVNKAKLALANALKTEAMTPSSAVDDGAVGEAETISCCRCNDAGILSDLDIEYDIVCGTNCEVLFIPHEVALQVCSVDSKTDDEMWLLAATEICWASSSIRDNRSHNVSLMADVRDHHAKVVHTNDEGRLENAPFGGLLLKGECHELNVHKKENRVFKGVQVLPPGPWRVKPHSVVIELDGNGSHKTHCSHLSPSHPRQDEVKQLLDTPANSPQLNSIESPEPQLSPIHAAALCSPSPQVSPLCSPSPQVPPIRAATPDGADPEAPEALLSAEPVDLGARADIDLGLSPKHDLTALQLSQQM